MEHGPDEQHLSSWEQRSLAALGLHQIPPASRLTQAFYALSSLHRETPTFTGSLPGPPALAKDLSLIRLLIYARRTYLITHRLRPLLERLAPFQRIAELGAGYAPALLALANLPAQKLAVERVTEFSLPRQRLFELSGHPPPEEARRSPSLLPRTLSIFAFSLFEFADGNPATAVQLIARSLDRQSACLALEPGDSLHATFLQRTRDLLAAEGLHPIAPCSAVSHCPFNSHKGWCHFTHPITYGPLTQRLHQVARRRADHLHFSFLLYSAMEPRTTEPTAWTLLSHHREGRKKHRAVFCTNDGLQTLVALKRSTAFEALASMLPATRIHSPHHLPPRGDGLRLSSKEDLQILHRLPDSLPD